MPQKKDVDYGLRSLKGSGKPAERLRDEILRKLSTGQAPWSKGECISANEIKKQTELPISAVTKTLQRLAEEGVFRVVQGSGYTILNSAPESRATTLVSVSSFCYEEGFECVSELDPKSCVVRPFRELAREICDDVADQTRFLKLAPALLGLGPDDHALFIRRVRGWHKKAAQSRLEWGILETLFLVPALVRGLEQRFREALRPVGQKNPLGNLSLHAWLSSNHVEAERSEYVLSLGHLSKRDQEAWAAVKPRPEQEASDVFFRLRAVTYGKDKVPLLFTVENVVPNMLDLKVTGFQFGDPAKRIFP